MEPAVHRSLALMKKKITWRNEHLSSHEVFLYFEIGVLQDALLQFSGIVLKNFETHNSEGYLCYYVSSRQHVSEPKFDFNHFNGPLNVISFTTV